MEAGKNASSPQGPTLQRVFIPMFLGLLAIDYFVQLIFVEQLTELFPLAVIWGSIGSAMYGIAGVQALYYLLDPAGETRSKASMSVTDTIKSTARLLADRGRIKAALGPSFLSGSLGALCFLACALPITYCASLASAGRSAVLAAFFLLRHNMFCVIPIFLIGAIVLSYTASLKLQSKWWLTLSLAALIALVAMLEDGRWHNHFFHLLNSLFSLQAWGCSLCWVGSFACIPALKRCASAPCASQTSGG